MKKFFSLMLIFMMISFTTYYSQEISDTQKMEILNDLNDSNIWVKYDALTKIALYNITEAVPKLTTMIWTDTESIRSECLQTLSKLNYPDIIPLAFEFIDSVSTFRSYSTPKDILEYKVEATAVLFEHGDYSTTHYIFDLIDSSTVYGNSITFNLLPDIIIHVPEYAQRAKEELVRIAFNSSDEMFKQNHAIEYLVELYGQEYIDEIAEVFINSDDTSVKLLIMDVLEKENYAGLKDLYTEDLAQDTNTVVKFNIIKKLLEKWGSPAMSLEIKESIAGIADQKKREIFDFGRIDYKPPRPLESTPLATMIDTLGLFTENCYDYEWLKDESYFTYLDELTEDATILLSNSDSIGCARKIDEYLTSIREVFSDSIGNYPKYVSLDAQRFLYFYPIYILDRLPAIPEDTTPEVRLLNSSGSPLTGGVCQYYEGGWQTATDNGDGTFSIETDRTSLSIRMTYAYGTQTLSNIPWETGPVVFQTVNAQVQLKDSEDNFLDEGTVKYYAGGWRDFGVTENGIASKELLPINYSFRMTYAYASNDKQQDLSADPNVVFHTVPATVQLKNSQGNMIDEGTVKYYAGGWRDFGTTASGEVTKELLPNNYSFRMTYAFASNDKQQNIGDDPTVIFQTVPATVQLKNSAGSFIDQGTVQYYSGGWRGFGTTTNGVATLELLPNNYSFRMTHEFISNDKSQNIGDNNTLEFSTINCIVQTKDQLGNTLDGAVISYYSGGWRQIGTTVNGEITKELLPKSLTFRAAYGGTSQDKTQDTAINNLVEFIIEQ